MSGAQTFSSALLLDRLRSRPVSRTEKLLLLLGYTALVLARMPHVVISGRLWAEEGNVYLANAWNYGWWGAIAAIHEDYFNLPATLATLLAVHLAPLREAPHITVAVALGIQLLPPLLLLTSGLVWLRDRLPLVAALLLVLTPPLSSEVWLNSITSHFHMMVAVAIILAAPVRGGAIGVLRGAVLLAAPLCGPGSIFAAPLFVLRALRDRSWGRAGQAALICAASLVQMAIYATHHAPGRHLALSLPLLLIVLFVKNLLVPVLGPHLARIADGHFIQPMVLAHHWPLLPIAGSVLGFGLLGAAIWWRAREEVAWLYACALVMALLSYMGAMLGGSDMASVDFGMRYAYAPMVLIGLSVLGLAATAGGMTRLIAGALVAWLIVIGGTGVFPRAARDGERARLAGRGRRLARQPRAPPEGVARRRLGVRAGPGQADRGGGGREGPGGSSFRFVWIWFTGSPGWWVGASTARRDGMWWWVDGSEPAEQNENYRSKYPARTAARSGSRSGGPR